MSGVREYLERLGVSDRYVDAFCGRVPRSVLVRHMQISVRKN